MIKRDELISELRNNGFKGFCQRSKTELFELYNAVKSGAPVISNTQPKTQPNNERCRYIRSQPRQVEVTDVVTNESFTYPSIYKAAKAIGSNPGAVSSFNGRVWRDRYRIAVI